MDNHSSGMHPDDRLLALYSSGDLPLGKRFGVRRHVSNCAHCDDQVKQFKSAAGLLRQEAKEDPFTGLAGIANWSALEREMVGNIKVGLDAARCIDKVGRGRLTGWRVAISTGVLSIILTVGWVMNVPSEQRVHLVNSLQRLTGKYPAYPGGTVVQTTPHGIAVRSQGATLTLLSPSSATVSFSGASAVGARYIDDETGQITITNVYGQ